MSGMSAASGLNPPIMLRLPSSYHFLPHLLDDPSSLRLRYLLSKGRNGVSVVLGIPTVRREKQSYLMDTLQNLVDGMTTEEADDALIVIFVAEVSKQCFPYCYYYHGGLDRGWNTRRNFVGKPILRLQRQSHVTLVKKFLQTAIKVFLSLKLAASV